MTDDMYEHLVYDDFVFTTPAAGRAGALRAHAHHQRRLQGLLHDRLAHRLWRRPGAADQGDGDAAVAVDLQPASISQWAAVEALNGPQDFIAKHNAVFKERRDLVVVDAQPGDGINCPTPEGAFYVYPSCAGAHRQDARRRAR